MADPTDPAGGRRLTFGPFELVAAQKALFEAGRPVRLGGRALDVLIALVQRAGDLVSKQELIAVAWPDTVVDEANLRVHVAALRKVLGDGQAGARYIVNVSGRGYRFVAPISPQPAQPPVPDADADAPPQPHNLPAPLVRMVGRADIAATLAGQMARRRFVTIVGPGGVGKSTVALAVAEHLIAAEAIDARFVDLAALADGWQVPAAVATVVGLSVLSDDPVAGLLGFFEDKQMLLVFDNCEHVIEAAACLAEAILKSAPGVRILATSREPLRAEGERVHRLRSLETPPPTSTLTAAAALAFPAVQLFVERAKANLDMFELTDAEAPLVSTICRRLDGIPLAIELAAARVDVLGISALATELGDRFLILARGRRTALPRHQTLRAMLDWSYDMLPAAEQTILCRLGVFRGWFTLEAAAAVAADDALGAANVLDGVVNLAAKSLLTTDVSGSSVHHRLLHMTRVYASTRLMDGPDGARTRRRHADYCRDLLARAEADWERMTRPQWLAGYGAAIDDIRAALDWAFSADGDAGLGVALAAAALPLGFQLSLIDEFQMRARHALERLAALSPPQPFVEMRLRAAYGRVVQNTAGPVPGGGGAFARALELAEQLGLPKYQVEPLSGLAIFETGRGATAAGLAAAERLAAFAHSIADPVAMLVSDRTSAQVRHYAGDHATARLLAERVIDSPIRTIPLAYGQTSVDVQVSMRIVLARILWIGGWPDQAVQVAGESLRLAEADSAFSLCLALALAACPIALWRGDDAAARAFTQRLLEEATRYTLAHWHAWGQCYGMVLSRRAVAGAGAAYAEALAAAPGSHAVLDMLATIAEDLVDAETVARAGSGDASWCGPEVLRAAGQALLRQGAPDADATAEVALLRSLAAARRHEARSWELRTGLSLARLWRRQDRAGEARGLLAPIFGRFTEGFATADLIEARRLLEELGAGGGP